MLHTCTYSSRLRPVLRRVILDTANGESVMELLRELHASGATICMVTHDPRYEQQADRVVHLVDGQTVTA